MVNSAVNASAKCIQTDNSGTGINCDLECSGATHGNVWESDRFVGLYGSRFKGTESGKTLVQCEDGVISGNAFFGAGALGITLSETNAVCGIVSNTFYNIGTCIRLPNKALAVPPIIINNHATDCSKWIDNPFVGTQNHAVIEVNNRTRDNTTPRTGIGDGANVGEVTTDTGGAETDYVDAPGGDITLIPTAPGLDAGLGM